MKTERELAELIFDKFRDTKCKEGEIVLWKTIRFSVLNHLNPKEQEVFDTVLNGLIYTGYCTYENTRSKLFRLTKKGFDYIYDDEKTQDMLNKPWIVPSNKDTDWEETFKNLWAVIGKEDSAPYYLGGPKFYDVILQICDTIPGTYGDYIEVRKNEGKSTSRFHYYKELIDALSEEQRFELYAKLQIYIEQNDSSLHKGSKNAETTKLLTRKQNEEDVNTDSRPKVFISYSWDDSKHKEWVLKFATKLMENGINVILDRWELDKYGTMLPNFMEQSISQSERVICVMTPNYKKKTENLEGGVGYEYSIISASFLADSIKTTKFIPLLRLGDDIESIPESLKGRMYIDMREDNRYDTEVEKLLRDIYDEPEYQKPKIGTKPIFKKK